jgi:hypothetical protein
VQTLAIVVLVQLDDHRIHGRAGAELDGDPPGLADVNLLGRGLDSIDPREMLRDARDVVILHEALDDARAGLEIELDARRIPFDVHEDVAVDPHDQVTAVGPVAKRQVAQLGRARPVRNASHGRLGRPRIEPAMNAGEAAARDHDRHRQVVVAPIPDPIRLDQAGAQQIHVGERRPQPGKLPRQLRAQDGPVGANAVGAGDALQPGKADPVQEGLDPPVRVLDLVAHFDLPPP